MEGIAPGLSGRAEVVVNEENTARHLGSGRAPVLGTPEMVRLMEVASVAAVDHLLPDGRQTVGVHLDVHHLAATPPGMKVTAHSELIAVDGRRLTFRVEVFDEVERVGEGTHGRVIVDVARFADGVERKAGSG